MLSALPRQLRQKLMDAVEDAVLLYPKIRPDDGRLGAFLTVSDLHKRVLLQVRLGQVRPDVGDDGQEKVEKYRTLSEEKAVRLLDNLQFGHKMSYESRDPAQNRWGGAVLAVPYVVSVSGLKEADDEACALIGCVAAGFFDAYTALARAVMNPDATFNRYYEVFCRRPVAPEPTSVVPGTVELPLNKPSAACHDDEADPIAT